MDADARVAELIAAAKSKGLAVGDRPARPRTVATRPAERQPAKPRTPRELATLRRLPMAWTRGKSPDRKAWQERDRSQRLAELETKLAAGLIALALGDEWHREENHHHSSLLVHQTGCRLLFGKAWNGNRYAIRPIDCHLRRDGDLPTEITVAANRTPASIAGDIQSRLVNHGLIAGWLAWRDNQAARRRGEINERLAALRMARALGRRRYLEERYWRDGRPTTPCVDIQGGEAWAALTYDGQIRLTITTTDADLAERVLASLPR